MPRYFLSEKAVDDLSNIWEYTYDNWSEKQADIYYGHLINACLDLSKAPHKGKSYYHILPGIMGVASGSHIIFYQIIDAGDIVIVRILHERMDARTLFAEK
ncbi:MAG: type II toxin-antitoxin system RelE/ParE family toxin [Candidatus Kapabacteria bacterium]|nr:type II toxin-antitoxin system RelE/ParE family toxin [Candidatus Kapabacteria bacterium]